MEEDVGKIARSLSRQYGEQACLIFGRGADSSAANRWRSELRCRDVPVLELNDAPPTCAEAWLEAAVHFSTEFLTPVVVFAEEVVAEADRTLESATPSQRQVDDPDWLQTRQVALTRAVETSPLNQEFRRSRERRGWIRLGWQPETALAEGNGLQLAWSSPLPLRRIRDFAARCPEITLIAPDAEALAAEVAAQGISVTGWRFAVK